MKLAIVIISEGFAGAERVVYDLLKEFDQKKNMEVSLFVNREIKKYYEDIPNIEVYDLGRGIFRNKFKSLYAFYSMRRKLRAPLNLINPDVINTHMEFANVISPAWKNQIPVFHGSDVKSIKKSPHASHKFFFAPKLIMRLNSSKKLISVSRWQIEGLPEEYKSKTIVIPNGVDTKVFRRIPKIKQRKNVVLFTGRLIELKGIREILEVAKQLPQYEFWFAGKGELAKEIEKVANCKNLGFKTTDELVKLYNEATISSFPSHREALPLCGLEAMACGRAVVATPLGFSEYMENGTDGLIVASKNVRELKHAIEKLMTNEKKRKAIEKNARKKAEKYSWDKVADAYLRVFKEVEESQ